MSTLNTTTCPVDRRRENPGANGREGWRLTSGRRTGDSRVSKEQVANQKTSVRSITAQALAQLKKQGMSVELLDVRTPVVYREVHVEGARNVPLDKLDCTGHNYIHNTQPASLGLGSIIPRVRPQKVWAEWHLSGIPSYTRHTVCIVRENHFPPLSLEDESVSSCNS